MLGRSVVYKPFDYLSMSSKQDAIGFQFIAWNVYGVVTIVVIELLYLDGFHITRAVTSDIAPDFPADSPDISADVLLTSEIMQHPPCKLEVKLQDKNIL